MFGVFVFVGVEVGVMSFVDVVECVDGCDFDVEDFFDGEFDFGF